MTPFAFIPGTTDLDAFWEHWHANRPPTPEVSVLAEDDREPGE